MDDNLCSLESYPIILFCEVLFFYDSAEFKRIFHITHFFVTKFFVVRALRTDILYFLISAMRQNKNKQETIRQEGYPLKKSQPLMRTKCKGAS